MDNIAIILGGSYLNEGVYDRLKEKKYYVIVIDWNKNPYLKGDMHLQIDVKDSKSVIEKLIKIGVNKNNYKITYTSIDLAVKTLNEINKLFNKKYCPFEAIQNVSAKDKMTNIWKEHKLLNRFSIRIDNEESIKDIIKQLVKFKKIIVKPNVSSSSRGISILENFEYNDILKAINKAKNYSYDDYVVIEEFISGNEFTVEMLGDDYGNVCVYGISKKYHTINAGNNKIAVKLHFNSIEEELQERMANFGIECYKALKLKNTFGHLEIIQKEDGSLVPIEIGARSSGFIASHLLDYVSGKNYLDDYEKLINGGRVCNSLIKQKDTSSMYFFYDLPFDKVSKSKANLLDFIDVDIKSLYFDRSKLKPNQKFKMINSDMERYGYEILVGNKKDLTIENINKAEKKILNFFFSKCDDFYDAHAHIVENQRGGVLIALEGEPYFDGVLNNQEVIELENKENYLFAVQYIRKEFNKTITDIVKYHPRREQYKPTEVINDIYNRKPKIVLIDTLNQPYWQPIDYWNIAIEFPNIQFVMCHAGGYDIYEFIKMTHFQENIWIDFSLTQEYFGWNNDINKNRFIIENIDYALNNKIIRKKILFGSDNLFFSQVKAYLKYKKLECDDILKDNFFRLLKAGGIL